MNIALLINSFNLGGAETLCYNLAHEYSSKNNNVVVISMAPIQSNLEKTTANSLKSSGIKVDTVNKPYRRGRLKSIFRIAFLCYKYHIDVLHTNSQSADFYGRLSKLLRPKTKTVVTIHNTAGYSKRIEHFQKKLTDCYTTISEQAKTYCLKELSIKDNIHLILNGINFCNYVDNIRNIHDGCLEILSVGRVVEQKGYLELAPYMNSLLKEHENYRWIIVGDTTYSSAYYNKVKNCFEDGVRDRIVFVGTTNAPWDYYYKSDIFLLGSNYEGFGIVFVEAIAAGLPVIAHPVGILPELKNVGGEYISLKLTDLNSNINSARLMSLDQRRKNRDLCKQMYGIEKTADEFIALYHNVIRPNCL